LPAQVDAAATALRYHPAASAVQEAALLFLVSCARAGDGPVLRPLLHSDAVSVCAESMWHSCTTLALQQHKLDLFALLAVSADSVPLLLPLWHCVAAVMSSHSTVVEIQRSGLSYFQCMAMHVPDKASFLPYCGTVHEVMRAHVQDPQVQQAGLGFFAEVASDQACCASMHQLRAVAEYVVSVHPGVQGVQREALRVFALLDHRSSA
jgi:hypothetical protein